MTRSRMESALRALIMRAVLPAPQTNVKVAGYEVDMHWPAHRLVVDFDGWSTHSSRTAFESDRLKDAALQLAGERVLWVSGRQLERRRPEALVSPRHRDLGQPADDQRLEPPASSPPSAAAYPSVSR